MTEKKRYGLMIFLVIIMIGTTFSFIFYGFDNPAAKAKENGILFVHNGQVWLAKVNGRQAAFSFLPSETSVINTTGSIDLKNKIQIDITSDLNDRFNQSIALSHHQMGLTLSQYNVFLRNGFTKNNSYSMPIIQCKDATSSVPVIYFKSSNSTMLSVEGNCIIAQGSSDADIIRIKDRLLYDILGVLNG